MAAAGAAGGAGRLSGPRAGMCARAPGARSPRASHSHSLELRRRVVRRCARTVPGDTEEPRCPVGGQSDTTKQKQHGLRQTVCLSAGAHAPTTGMASAPQMLCHDGDGGLETGLSGSPNP